MSTSSTSDGRRGGVTLGRVKQFAMTNQLLEHDLDRIEAEFDVDLGRPRADTTSAEVENYYPQIEVAFRAEAAAMAPHYEIFYSLEKTIRRLVVDVMEEAEGEGWWDSARVPNRIQVEVADRRQREIDSGTTPRSDNAIDFCTFGELGEIIRSNWDAFGSIFSSQKAVTQVMTRLNSLRGPIAHCSPLAEDEVLRLRLTVRDWFRLMS